MASNDIPTQSTQATQRGPGTEPASLMISGVRVEFPCRPYPSQMAMMGKVIQGLKTGKNCLLESPTGSGKSLALLCSALAWQRHEAERVLTHNAEIEARHEAAIRERMEQKKKRQSEEQTVASSKKDLEAEENVKKDDDKSLISNTNEIVPGSSIASSSNKSSPPVYDITDDEDDDDFKPTKRSRTSASSSRNTSLLTSDSSGDAENLQDIAKVTKEIQQADTKKENVNPGLVPADKYLTVPKIFFGTRTHKQIAQILRELRKTPYRNIRSIILASRDHTCINPSVEKLSNKNEACRELLQNGANSGNGCLWHAGSRKMASFGALGAVGLSPAYDVEDLVTIGRKHHSCPYYLTRYLMPNADIIFCPYNYMIDPSIRKSMNLELEGHVLIFDEGHNIEDASRESSSFSLKQEDIQRAMQDCEKIARLGNEPFAHNAMATFLSSVSQWMDMQVPQLREQTFNSSAKCWNGNEFLGSVFACGMTEESIKLNASYFAAIIEQRDKQMEAVKERGGRFVDEKPVLATVNTSVIEGVFRLFDELCRDSGRYRSDFRVALLKETVKRRRDGNYGPMISVQVLSLNLWCLNPSVAFEFLKKNAHSIILTSGTLSPMQSFESELGALFPLKLEASHVIGASQCWAAVVGSGPNGVNLNGSYQNSTTLKYQDELGLMVLRVCQTIPYGILCFFPSYKMLENMLTRWSITGLYEQIQAVKVVVVEPRSGPDLFQEAMETFYNAVSTSSTRNRTSSITGALFLAVCRGKVSEGLDFADNNARAVICVGIPFPNVKDMQVELKRDYNNRNTSRGLLPGGEWYEIQAFRALNQALGRCIRHKNDWGAILLVDDRYIRQPRYVNALSKWIRSRVQNFPNWSSVENSLQEFRNGMAEMEEPLASAEENTSTDTQPNQAQDGAIAPIGIVMGNNNDDNSVTRSSAKVNSTSSLIPFANSFSSSSSLDNGIVSKSHERTSPSKLVNDTSTSMLSPVASESPKPSFKLPVTPLSIFSRKTNQGNKSTENSNMIASMFAKQVQKNSDRTGREFNPAQIEVGSNQSTVQVSSPENTNSTSRTKRRRENKIRL